MKALASVARLIMTLAVTALVGINAHSAGPKYIFYFIGDGMGVGQVMSAQTYNRVALGNDDRIVMMQFPVASMLETYSASSNVTDSAAAGTALATGHKTNNGMLGVTPDSTAVTSVAKVLHDNGWGVSLVTSVAPDDATPGAFYAHVPSRGMLYEIGRQAAESGYEFIAGSSWRAAYDREGKSTGLLEYMQSLNIDLATNTSDARSSEARRVFLYSDHPFTDGNAGFTIDSIPGALRLPDMTLTAIEHMKRVSPDHFFMMVEGGNIDHAAHGNDGSTVAIEVLNFNEALQHAYDFYLEHPDETLIVVTADHETGGMSVGNRRGGYAFNAHSISYQKMSKDMFSAHVKKLLNDPEAVTTWEQYKEIASTYTGLWSHIKVSEGQESRLKQLFDDTFEKRKALSDERTLYSSYNALATETYKVANDNIGFGWTTGGHSGNPVPLYAIGCGAEAFGSLMDNTEVAPKMMQIAGYKLN